MRTNLAAAALFTCLGLCALAAPALADEPAKAGSAPNADAKAPATAPGGQAPTTGAPQTGAPQTGTNPPAGAPQTGAQAPQPYPAQAPYPYPAPPQGYAPGGAAPQGYPPPQGGYPPPGYAPPGYAPPGYAPRGYGPPPGYYPYPRYATPVRVDGAKADDFKVEKESVVSEEDAGGSADHALTPKQRRRRATALIAAGGGALGAGWLLSVAHGLVGEIAGISCSSGGSWGFPSCSQTSHYTAIYIPVVGPVIEAATHQGNFTGLDMMGVVLETALQVGGITMLAVGVSSRSASAPPTSAKAPALTIALAPAVTPRSASMGVIGTF